eukprot:COSAG02_NODE_5427_length_4339_cov_2.935377_4_plen_59_part_00
MLIEMTMRTKLKILNPFFLPLVFLLWITIIVPVHLIMFRSPKAYTGMHKIVTRRHSAE